MRSFVLSDIHGCATTLRHMVESIINLTKQDSLYFLGDYIDRGPDSKGVIDYILELKEKGHNVRCLLGNHEDMLLQSFSDNTYERMWLINGGDTSLKSFGVSTIHELDEKYISFFKELELYIELENYILVHAGLDFKSDNIYSGKDVLVWTRYSEVDPLRTGNRIVVHGHTPLDRERILSKLNSSKENFEINIDGGCVYALSARRYGYLCCLHLETKEMFFSENLELQ